MKRPAAAVCSSLILLAIIGVIDWFITSDVSVSTLYLVPVCLAVWLGGRAAGLSMALLAGAVWFVAEYYGRTPASTLSSALWQALSRSIFYLLIAMLVGRIRSLTRNLENLVRERTADLEAEVAHRKALEREAAEVTEREQERVAHELHDQLAAYLAGVAFRAASLADALSQGDSPEAERARGLVLLVNGATDQVRNLARLLAPASKDVNLRVALSCLAAETEVAFGITCVVEVCRDLPGLPKEISAQLCRIAQEAVRNAIQHGRAHLVRIDVRVEQSALNLRVQNDGDTWEPSTARGDGLGLRIMRFRSERIGGQFSVCSPDTGGTLVTCRVPVAEFWVKPGPISNNIVQ